jgi:hypothetical protein
MHWRRWQGGGFKEKNTREAAAALPDLVQLSPRLPALHPTHNDTLSCLVHTRNAVRGKRAATAARRGIQVWSWDLRGGMLTSTTGVMGVARTDSARYRHRNRYTSLPHAAILSTSTAPPSCAHREGEPGQCWVGAVGGKVVWLPPPHQVPSRLRT